MEEYEKIIIEKNPNGDTRTAPKNVSFKQFQKANDMHISDVKNVLSILINELNERSEKHDFTKKSDEELFYENFLSTINNDTDFVNDKWYQMHIQKERHHLFSRCPEDVNLIDVLEMICDCVTAGLARSGNIRDLEINTDILNKAVQNTVKLLTDKIIVVEKDCSSEKWHGNKKFTCSCGSLIDFTKSNSFYFDCISKDRFLCRNCLKIYNIDGELSFDLFKLYMDELKFFAIFKLHMDKLLEGESTIDE